MKCIVFSDSHGNTRNMRQALLANPDAEAVFYLGDGLSDADIVSSADSGRAWIAVAGNCDFSPMFRDSFVKKTDKVTLDGQRIVLTHGDLYGAKYGIGGLLSLAKEESASILLFGHTHEPCEKYLPTEDAGVYLFNPGSIGAGSYGIVLICEKGILLSHGKI